MSNLASTYSYAYAFRSAVDSSGDGSHVRLATSGSENDHPYFFSGRLRRARLAADMLTAIGSVVANRFFTPWNVLAAGMLDPVVTCSERMLRFEGFSSCCSAYVRADFSSDSWEDGRLYGRGTTNVDFNPAMRSALTKVSDRGWLNLDVGAEEVRLASPAATAVERRVDLPVRWLKAFVEVQQYQAGMQRCLEVSGVEARRFLGSVPQGASPRDRAWVQPLGRGLRLSRQEVRDSIAVVGFQRLKTLDFLARHARTMRVYAGGVPGGSVWELDAEAARFWMALTPEPSRGFSGEGQALESLAEQGWSEMLTRVRAELTWQSHIEPAEIAGRIGCGEAEVTAALAALGARGLVGYDLHERAYFHRVLPFAVEKVHQLQPRLRAAEKLIAAGGVRVLASSADATELLVRGTDVEHVVRLTPASAACTCPWYAKHQAERGPCKHILAAKIFIDSSTSTTT